MIIEKVIKYGLSKRKLDQWRKILSRCEGATYRVPR